MNDDCGSCENQRWMATRLSAQHLSLAVAVRSMVIRNACRNAWICRTYVWHYEVREVLQRVIFRSTGYPEKVRRLTTPIGICLVSHEQRNGFRHGAFQWRTSEIMAITMEPEQSWMQHCSRLSKWWSFPKRGRTWVFVNGAKRIVRGEPGESAEVYMMGETKYQARHWNQTPISSSSHHRRTGGSNLHWSS